MNIKDLHGAITKCDRCSNSNPATPMPCAKCFCRGFVAECLQCSGKGQIEEPVAGGAKGTMMSTCPACGGTRCFGVNKPDDWDAKHPPEPIEETAETAPVADSTSTAVYENEKQIPKGQAGWQTPAPRPGAHVTPVPASS